MKQLKNLLPLLSVTLLLSSCYTTIFNSMGLLKKTASLKIVRSSEKEIVYIPMHHIGKKEFYTDVKTNIDSLRKEGFVFYYEGVNYSRDTNRIKNDTLAMKLRKVIGLDFRALKSQGGYIDTLNNSLLGKKVGALKRHKLVNQPLQNFFFDSTKDRKVDAYLSDALAASEEKFGNILLTDCDFSTKPDAKYTCEKFKDKKARQFLLLNYRDSLIASEILKDGHKKIAMVYGAKHFKGVLKNLQKQDSNWKVQ